MKAGFGTGVAPEPGAASSQPSFTPPPLAEMAKLFPQFEIAELLGRGGMGVVYRARQHNLDRWVALKVLPPQSTSRPGFAERFNREARALARLNHPNIVAVHEFGQAGGMPYFVMEYVEGVTLRRLVQERRLEPREALKIVPQICVALQFAHEQGVVHRDIKPENILVDKQGRVKIADFGIAKIVGTEGGGRGRSGDEGSDAAGEFGGSPAGGSAAAGTAALQGGLTQDQVLGTPHYMAPEQVEKPATVDHRADIYSLGVVFYEMLTGELPLGKFQPPSKKVQVDVRLDEVVLHALEKEPERRYQRVSEVKTDVERIAAQASPNAESARAHLGQESLPVYGAPRQPSEVGFTAESVRTQFVLLAITWWIGMPLSIVSDLLPRPGNLLLGVFCLPLWTVTTVFWCILLYRHWRLLQGHGARTTPGKAVGFGFIPFYGFYWWFVAYAGLATDNNRYLDEVGITSARMSRGLAIAACVLGVLLCTVGLIPGVGAVVMIPYMIASFIAVLQQRNCVLAILQHRSRMPANESQPFRAG